MFGGFLVISIRFWKLVSFSEISASYSNTRKSEQIFLYFKPCNHVRHRFCCFVWAVNNVQHPVEVSTKLHIRHSYDIFDSTKRLVKVSYRLLLYKFLTSMKAIYWHVYKIQKQPSRSVLRKKVFRKYAAKLQENTHAQLWFQ